MGPTSEVAHIAAAGAAGRATTITLEPTTRSAEPPTGLALEDEGDEEDEEVELAARDLARPCAKESTARRDAEASLGALVGRVTALADGADPTPLGRELASLLATPCLELAALDPKDPLAWDSALSLRTWWSDGGSAWLRGTLELEDDRIVHLPPTPRKTLTIESTPKDHPLRPLLCPSAGSGSCGRDAAGFIRRAEADFVLLAGQIRAEETLASCAKKARREAPADRYASFRACVEGLAPRGYSLPLGRFEPPRDGWLVMVGAHGTCAELTAHDLASGTRIRAQRCPGRSSTTAVGRVPLGALREAALMLMLAPETQGRVRRSASFEVPEGIPIVRAHGIGLGRFHLTAGCGTHDRHDWTWLRDKRGTFEGQVSGTFLGSGQDEATRRALALLSMTDAAFEEGCAPRGGPRRVTWGAPGPTLGGEAPPQLDDPNSADVRAAFLALRASPRACPAKL